VSCITIFGRAIAQEIIRWLLTAETGDQSGVISFEILVGQRGTGTGCLPVYSIFPFSSPAHGSVVG
jgi:hypothetical protein